MLNNIPNTPLKPVARRAIIAALLLGTALGAGGFAFVISAQPSLAAAAVVTAPLGLPPVAAQAGFASLVEKVKPAVVQIATTGQQLGRQDDQDNQDNQDNQASPQMPNLPQGPFGDMLRQHFGNQNHSGTDQQAQPEEHALGSGFIIDTMGYIVTNNHVVDGAHDISVTLNDGNKYSAKVVGRDAKTDLALLKIDAGKSLPYVAFGDSDSEHEGDWVIAVGNPYGLGGTVTAGIISAHGRDINAGPYDDFLQIDAPINPGNSGGPLFNQSGQVVGIDTAIYSPSGGSVGIGFAIPSNVVKNVVAQLRDHGLVARGWLGVEMQPMTATLAKAVGLPNDEGVLVNSVESNSPASRADLQQGDVITAFDGKPIKSTRDLAIDVANIANGKTASMAVWRNNHQRMVDVTIASQQQEKVATAQGASSAPAVGMSLEALTPETRSQLNLDSSIGGVVVAQVTPGSKADESGIQAGDIIERVAGTAVSTPAQVADAIRSAEQQKKEAVALLVRRDGAASYLGLQLAAG